MLLQVVVGCKKTPEIVLENLPEAPTEKAYFFVGHCYDWNYYAQGNRVDYRIEALDLSIYDQIWLGGDICTETTKDAYTVHYLDELFNISSPTTHWTLGNHDARNKKTSLITNETQRNTFYATHFDGITLVVLNTNVSFNYDQELQTPTTEDCAWMDEQYLMVKNVMDTISSSSHLIFLHHHALLTDAIEDIPQWVYNAYFLDLPFACSPQGQFHQLIYPQLVEVKNSGIEVLFIGGDFGARAKTFEHQTAEGIWFIGSGINNTCPVETAPTWVTDFSPDKILTLYHNIETQTITWRHHDLDSLLAVQ